MSLKCWHLNFGEVETVDPWSSIGQLSSYLGERFQEREGGEGDRQTPTAF